MIPKTDWEPSKKDLAWQKELLRVMDDTAVWGVPASCSVFQFDKRLQTFCLITGDPNDEVNMRIAKVLRMLGYRERGPTKKEIPDDDDS